MKERKKTCTKCGEEKSIYKFYRQSASRDGFDQRCAECKNAVRRSALTKSPEAQEFRRGDVWVFEEDGRQLTIRVLSLGFDPWCREKRVNGWVGGKRRTVRAALVRAGRLVSREETAA